MTTDVPETNQYSRKRRHFRGYRHLKVILLALGLAGLILGLGMAGGYIFHKNVKLLNLGLVYMIISLIVLGLRGIMVYLGRSRG
ncbi:MAG: hypothetical protein PHR77_14160 [Kiritimatiellae bacterium]|nr:hypothetical protein [Kiritimatiellia bacterium]MDD5521667.1 hypothetical protein [Kiritimatiellia bacterium]